MPKQKPMPRDIKSRGGRLDRGSIASNPLGNRAERRAAAKKAKRREGR